jgi:hypothetical protein
VATGGFFRNLKDDKKREFGGYRFNGYGDREHAQLKHPFKDRRKIMKLKIRTPMTFALIALTISLFSLAPSLALQSKKMTFDC